MLIVGVICVVIGYLAFEILGRFVYVSPGYFNDNDNLTEEENYWIKKSVTESLEHRYHSQGKTFIWIDTDFMDTVQKINENEYVCLVNTHFLEDGSDDATLEIVLDKEQGYSVTSVGVDP